jgi:hypothetical protein
MMASGEIRLLPTMSRRMPVLAQSQAANTDTAPSGLGLTQDQWAQFSQSQDPAQNAQAETSDANPQLTPTANPVPGALTPQQIQDANDAWSDVQAANDRATQDWAKGLATGNFLDWQSDIAQAARFWQNYYNALGTPASPLTSPNNGVEPGP